MVSFASVAVALVLLACSTAVDAVLCNCTMKYFAASNTACSGNVSATTKAVYQTDQCFTSVDLAKQIGAATVSLKLISCDSAAISTYYYVNADCRDTNLKASIPIGTCSSTSMTVNASVTSTFNVLAACFPANHALGSAAPHWLLGLAMALGLLWLSA